MGLIFGLIELVIGAYILYSIIRAAVRDGMTQAWERRDARRPDGRPFGDGQ